MDGTKSKIYSTNKYTLDSAILIIMNRIHVHTWIMICNVSVVTILMKIGVISKCVIAMERFVSAPPITTLEESTNDKVYSNSTLHLHSKVTSSSYYNHHHHQTIRKEYYRFIPSTTSSLSSSSSEERNLGYSSGSLLPTRELRFNKFKYVTDEYALYYADFKPLISKDYPLYGYVNKTLRLATNVHSVITPDDYEVKYDIPSLLDAVGGYPPMPDENEDNVFWKYLGLVIHVQRVRIYIYCILSTFRLSFQ